MINKRGGDALQVNSASQGAGNYADAANVSASGNAFLDGHSGDSSADTHLEQDTRQYLDQVNDGVGGDGGYDNTEANTDIKI